MSATAYQMVVGNDPDDLTTKVNAAIGSSWGPLGAPFKMDNMPGKLLQAMIKGAIDTNNLATASAAVANGDTIAVHNSAGADSHNATAEVTANSLTDVKFAATVAMVDDADTVVVKNSAATTVTGTHTATVAAGVLSKVTLASTVAPVLNGGTLTGVTPSGSYSTTVTFTVASGVITAIALS